MKRLNLEKIDNTDFIPILKPIHRNHTKIVHKKLLKKMYTLKQALIKRSKEYDVKMTMKHEDIKRLFLKNYGKKCTYCNKTVLTIKTIACDHIKPISKGGESSVDNLQLICRTCNTRKGNLSDDEYRTLLRTLKLLPEFIENYVLKRLSKGGRY